MTNDQIKSIVEKYLMGKASQEETQQLHVWYQAFDDHPSFSDSHSKQEMEAVSVKMFDMISKAIDQSSGEIEGGADPHNHTAFSTSDSTP